MGGLVSQFANARLRQFERWSIGMIVLLVGLVPWAQGTLGHAVGGRRDYF